MREIMYITCALFILKLSVAVRSVLFMLHPPDQSVTICVDTASYHQVTCVVCKHDRKCRSCEYWYVVRVLLLLLFILTKFDVCQATVQRVIASQKSKKKQADFRVWLVWVFIKQNAEAMSEIDAVIVWIMVLSYIYHSERIFFCFQALTAFYTAYDCLRMFTE